ncbi:MAG: glycoside hydrolase family 15 protein [Planctomycetes bacterium]|nr:glycoside hydrolase family 15 protein [Planctomycetota bacterium]
MSKRDYPPLGTTGSSPMATPRPWSRRSARSTGAACPGSMRKAASVGIRLAEELRREVPVRTWKKNRDKIRQKIEQSGYDRRRGVFIQAFRRPVMDAALLLIPTVGFVAYDDERMIRTTNAIRQDLDWDGFLYRYPPGDDGLKGREGVFLACSFWLARCLAHQGRREEARTVFERALSAGNDLQLFSEEFDTRTGQMLGNFPQALTHLSLITAAVALGKIL